MTQPPTRADIGKDNWAAVFYAPLSRDVLPVRSRRKPRLFLKTSTPRSPVPAISGATLALSEADSYGDECEAPPQRQDCRNTWPIELGA